MNGYGMRQATAVGLLLWTASSGCVTGSLATTTGDLRGGTWSIDPVQHVHVGEHVRFSFVLKKPLARDSISAIGLADYCVFRIGVDADAVPVNADGRFLYSRDFGDAKPGTPINVIATAYRTVGTQDGMKVAGEWIQNESPYDEPDARVASAVVQLVPYQAVVTFDVAPELRGADFDSAVLTLYGPNESPTRILKQTPTRAGFTIDWSDGAGGRILFEPTWRQINASGQTKAELSILDSTGTERVLTKFVPTP